MAWCSHIKKYSLEIKGIYFQLKEYSQKKGGAHMDSTFN
jgi:hypothetical protein